MQIPLDSVPRSAQLGCSVYVARPGVRIQRALHPRVSGSAECVKLLSELEGEGAVHVLGSARFR